MASDSLNAVAKGWGTPRAADAASASASAAAQERGFLALCQQSEQWKTPEATLAPRKSSVERKANGAVYEQHGETFAEQVEKWATPRASMSENGNDSGSAQRLEQGANPGLKDQAAKWTTPQAHDESGGNPDRVRRFGTTHGGANLADDVTKWATPDTNSRGGAQDAEIRARQGHTVNLQDQAHSWATPTTRCEKGGGNATTRSDGKSRMDMLDWQAEAYSRPAPQAPDGPTSSPTPATSRPRLNPAFTAWLMGLPWWWTNPGVTSSARSAMAAYRSALRSHGQRLLGESCDP